MTAKKKTYLGGDMLNKGAQMLRTQERKALEGVDGIDLFNPMDDKSINDKAKNPKAEAIFAKDTEALLDSEVIVFDATESTGTTTEIGQVWGINYMWARVEKILSETDNADELRGRLIGLLQEIPFKKVYWQNTDIRNVATATETGLRRSFSFNQYLYGCLLDLSGEDMLFEDIIKELEKGEFKDDEE